MATRRPRVVGWAVVLVVICSVLVANGLGNLVGSASASREVPSATGSPSAAALLSASETGDCLSSTPAVSGSVAVGNGTLTQGILAPTSAKPSPRLSVGPTTDPCLTYHYGILLTLTGPVNGSTNGTNGTGQGPVQKHHVGTIIEYYVDVVFGGHRPNLASRLFVSLMPIVIRGTNVTVLKPTTLEFVKQATGRTNVLYCNATTCSNTPPPPMNDTKPKPHGHFSTGKNGWAISLNEPATVDLAQDLKEGAAGAAAIAGLLAVIGVTAPAAAVAVAVAGLLAFVGESISTVDAWGGSQGVYFGGQDPTVCILGVLWWCAISAKLYLWDMFWYNPAPGGY